MSFMQKQSNKDWLGKDKKNQVTAVKRVNNLPLFIVLAIMVIFMVMLVYAVIESSNQNNFTADKAIRPENAQDMAHKVISDQLYGVVPPSSMSAGGQQTYGYQGSATTANRGSGSPSGAAPAGAAEGAQAPVTKIFDRATGKYVAVDTELLHQLQEERLKLEQERAAARLKGFQQAIASPTDVSVGSSKSDNQSTTKSPNSDPFLDNLQQQANLVMQGVVSTQKAALEAQKKSVNQVNNGGVANTSSPSFQQSGYGQFAGAGDARWKLNSFAKGPSTAYELKAGFVLPSILLSGINSDLPGIIIAQVAQNVYDTATGRYLLIPQGSRLIGQYDSKVDYGQSRILVAWQRIILPDGKALDIGAMAGADVGGQAGLTDQVNNHYLRTFSSAVMMSAIMAGVALTQPEQSSDKPLSPVDSLIKSLGQQLGSVALNLLSKNLNTSPTLEIRPGYRFNVMVTKDIVFNQPYTEFSY